MKGMHVHLAACTMHMYATCMHATRCTSNAELHAKLNHVCSVVTPRPIALVSSVDKV